VPDDSKKIDERVRILEEEVKTLHEAHSKLLLHYRALAHAVVSDLKDISQE